MTTHLAVIGNAEIPVCGQDGWTVHQHCTYDTTQVTCKRCLRMNDYRIVKERARRRAVPS